MMGEPHLDLAELAKNVAASRHFERPSRLRGQGFYRYRPITTPVADLPSATALARAYK